MQKPDWSVFHQPAGMVPGGHELRPSLIEQQNTVQPEEQVESGPHNEAYAVPGRRMYRNGLTSSADAKIATRTRKLRRVTGRAERGFEITKLRVEFEGALSFRHGLLSHGFLREY